MTATAQQAPVQNSTTVAQQTPDRVPSSRIHESGNPYTEKSTDVYPQAAVGTFTKQTPAATNATSSSLAQPPSSRIHETPNAYIKPSI